MKKILFLSPFFYPEQISTGKYNSYLVEKFLEEGYEVYVIAFYPFYPEWVIKKFDGAFKGANVYRYGEWVKFPKSQILRRIILEVQYAYYVLKHLLRNKDKYDIVISIFPPVLFMLLSVGLLKKIQKIGIIHDVQGIMANAEGSTVRSVSALLMGFIEKLVYRRCDRLVCLSYSMRDIISMKYNISKEKCDVFYPFISSPKALDLENSEALDDMFENDFNHIVYSGALGEKQKPHKLFEFLCDLSGSVSTIKCHIFSRGPFYEELIKRSQEERREGVLFHDLVPEENLPELFNKSTVQVIPQASGTGAGAFPSKLPNLLAHGVPIYTICDKGSELDVMINKINFGISVHSWEKENMRSAMLKLLEKIEGRSHEQISSENNENILKEFDVKNFIASLTI